MQSKYKFKPYSHNIIFFDTEFSSNDVRVGELLSIGLVKYTGEELYLEFDYNGELRDWIKINVSPYLTNEKVSYEKGREMISAFVGSSKPYLISNVVVFDMAYLYKIFEFGKVNFSEFPIDFYSVLFTLGLDPRSFISEGREKFVKELGIKIDNYKKHYALDDAKLLREVYIKMLSK